MSEAGAEREWDLVVPADGEQLLAELRRHGVRPGQRLQMSVAPSDVEETDPERLPDYIGSFQRGQPDLAERSAEILQAEFSDLVHELRVVPATSPRGTVPEDERLLAHDHGPVGPLAKSQHVTLKDKWLFLLQVGVAEPAADQEHA